MDGQTNVLTMRFDGTVQNRREFLRRIRVIIIDLVGSTSVFDALINEIAKNIYDHAHGLGSLVIEILDGSFNFEVMDDGKISHNYEYCRNNSTLKGNLTNCGIGLGIIKDLAESEEIDLRIDTSRGFLYSGTFTPGRKRET